MNMYLCCNKENWSRFDGKARASEGKNLMESIDT